MLFICQFPDYNVIMRRFNIIILALFFLAGCQSGTEADKDHFGKVSQEIKRLKAESSAHGAQLPADMQNIKITVNFYSTSVDSYIALDTLFRYTDKNIAVHKNPAYFTRSGIKVGVAGKDFKAQLDFAKGNLRSSEETEIFLVVTPNNPGRIFVGQQIGVPRFYYANYWFTAVEYDFVTAGRSLEVTAAKMPNGAIKMSLTPVLSEFMPNKSDLVLTELTTTVIADPGQTIVIGSADTSSQNIANAILSYSKSGIKKQNLITVTPNFY